MGNNEPRDKSSCKGNVEFEWSDEYCCGGEFVSTEVAVQLKRAYIKNNLPRMDDIDGQILDFIDMYCGWYEIERVDNIPYSYVVTVKSYCDDYIKEDLDESAELAISTIADICK